MPDAVTNPDDHLRDDDAAAAAARDRRRLRIWLLGMLAFAGLYVLGSVWAIPHIEDHLEGEAVERLAENGIDTSGLTFDMDGRNIEVAGDVDSLEEAFRIDDILTAEWGIRDADVTELRVRDAEPAPTGTIDLVVERDGAGLVVLRGTVLSDEQRQTLLAEANAVFGAANVVDELTVSGLAESLEGADARVSDFATLFVAMAAPGVDSATATLKGKSTTLRALVADDAAAAVLEAATAGFETVNITALGADAGVADFDFEVGSGTVRLTGTVLSEAQRGTLVAAAEAAVGAEAVVDELVVSGLAPAIEGSDDRVAAVADLLAPLADEAQVIEAFGTQTGDVFSVDVLAANEQAAADIGGLEDLVPGEWGVTVTADVAPPPPANDLEALSGELAALQEELAGVTLFETGSNTLTAEAEGILDRAATAINQYPEPVVNIVGHTDSRGEADSNQALSQRRADAVRQYLIDQGVDGGRMTAEGRGESELKFSNEENDVELAGNRRVEFEASLP
ncbi:MAG: OmpA family protein [Acidimicrobiales bacterium]|nr:OmpA family protein [Acidimicrobiales bacterium]